MSSVALATGTLGIFAAASQADSQATAPEVPTAAQTAGLTSNQVNMLNSGQPIDVTMNPANGDIVSVAAAPGPLAITAAISNHNVCNSGDGCYFTNQPPLANQGFFGGAGTITGSWADRSGYSSGKWTVSACWSTSCGIAISPGSEVDLTSDVTGTSFTIYS